MKAIKNIKTLKDTLEIESNTWQEEIFAETGAIVVFSKNGPILWSSCGYIDLDYDAEYRYVNGLDATEYCEISSIEGLIAYIKDMEGYAEYLVDYSFGQFNKSDLFWAVYACIICQEKNQKHNDGTYYPDWSLFRIGQYQNHVTLEMALNEYDCCEFELDITPDTSLETALVSLSEQMRDCTEDIEEVPQYKAFCNIAFAVPSSFQELSAQLYNDALFPWLV